MAKLLKASAVAAVLMAGQSVCAQPAAGPAAGDSAHGQALFAQKCAACHAADAAEGQPAGPPLDGVLGRKAGTSPDFDYSTAMRAWGMAWTPALLDQFLTKPSDLTPGTKMAVSVPDDQDRADLVAFLTTLK